MSVTHILADLRQRNITVRTEGNDLRVIADKGALSPELRALLASHKQEIVKYLRRLDEGEIAEITPVKNRGPLSPLSFGQHRLWFLAQLEPDSSAYVIPAAVRIRGPLDAAALASSLDQVVLRHEVLRTVFVTEHGHPAQHVLEQMTAPFSLIDLRQDATQAEMVERWTRSEAAKPFSLITGPLLRATLLQLSDREHVLLLALHHIVADGWSIEVLVRELSAFYLAFQAKRPAEILPMAVQYADYAIWQQHWRESQACARQLSYWRKQLAELVPLDLPTDHPRLDRSSSRGAALQFVVPSKLASRLRLLGLEEEATLFMVLLAAFQVLLSRYSGQQQVAVGTPVANRERKEIEGLIGFFVNTLVLFVDTGKAPSVRRFLGQVRKTALDAFENQDLPFEQLVDELQPTRSLNQNPLFQVMFMLQNVPRAEVQLGGITLQPFSVDTQSAKFDLTLGISEDGGQLQGWLNYNAELFDPATIARMAEHYCTLLSGMAERPEQSLSELSLVGEAERRQLLVEWNQTAVAYPQELVQGLFEQQAARTPGAIALEYQDRQQTYAELNSLANQLARYVKALGASPEVRVGICMERSSEMIAGLLATLKTGAAYVPLDPSSPAERLEFMLHEAQASVILTQRKFVSKLPQHHSKIVALDSEWDSIAAHNDENFDSHAAPDNLAYVMFTSGSTGRPKGVMVTHGGLANYLQWAVIRYPVNKGQGSPLHTSLSFDLSLTSLLPALITGQRVIVMPEGDELQAVVRGMQGGQGFSLLKATPSHLHVFREMLTGQDAIATPAAFVIGGEALSYEDVKWWRENAPSARLINEYGPTETVVGCCVYEVGPQDRANGPISIGQPIANTRLYVVDQYGALAPVGVPGELCIGGAGVARGYVNRPNLTAERFVPNHFSGTPGDRLYRTGDKVRWSADGNLDYLGRIDDQVKIRGHRIELGEIEAVLARHVTVKQAVVIMREDQPGDKRLVAYVVCHDTNAGDRSNALREYLRERLSEYMAPAAIVELETFPLTANGKIDRKVLPAPEYRRSEEQTAPRNVEEEILCGIFAEVLKLERIGIEQNFFDAGGHSLLATQVVSRIKSALGVELPLRALFESPTVAGLRERVERARYAGASAMPPLARVSRDTVIPLSFAQQRLWFLDQFQPNSPTYNSSVALHLHGELKLNALEWALSEIIRRHEVLRTRMEAFQGQPRQVIAEAGPVSISVTDLSVFDADERDVHLRSSLRDEAAMPFDLSKGPLLRVRLVRQSEQDHVLLATMHHIVTDGWSVGIMVQELSKLYQAGVLGVKSPLPELPVQYADFALWQREWLQGEVLERQTTYWKKQLSETPALEMPTDYPRSGVESEAGASLKWELPEALGHKLQELSRREGVTLFMTLLATFHLLLSRHSSQNDIATGSPIAGRTRTELEGLIGFFANTLVLRSDLSGRPTFREFLARVREMTLAAYAHQDVPFEKLVEELQPDRDLSRSPLFQAMFLLQNAPLGELELPGIRLSIIDRVAETAHFELLLSAFEEKGKIAGGLSYRTQLFSEDSMARLLARWQNLLTSIVSGPQKRIGELAMLSEAEHRQVVNEWNRTDVQYPQRLVHEIVEDHATNQLLEIAVDHDGRQLTYGELNNRANQLARYLRKMGAGPEGLIGVCMERSLDMIVGVLAILKTGAAYVPLDPKYPSSRLSYMIENSKIELLVLQEQFQPTFSGQVKRAVCLDTEWQKISEESSADLNIAVDAENLAFVVYTSGSTGWPKGAALRHGHLANLIGWHLERASESVLRTLQFASLSFDVSFQDIFATLCAGACLVLIDEDDRRDPFELWRTLCDQKVERVAVPFVALQQLAEVAIRKPGTSSLRVLITSGEQLKTTPALQKLLHQVPGCVLENQYGPSEAHVVTTYRLGKDPNTWVALPPIGRPVANTQVYLLNEEFVPAPAGVTAEVFLAGDQLARGYVNRPELTAERFLPNPFSKEPGGRMYATGDLARYLGDGNIEYLGRIDFQVKIRGYRVEVGEVESVLSECEGVGQSAVVVREDRPGEKRLVAYVVARDGQQLSEDELRNDLKARLPDFMVPAAVLVMEQFPLTPSGKVDRKRLPNPGESVAETGHAYVGPRNATEEILCGIWEDLLKRAPIGINQNFFEVGGHSLLAMQLVARITDALRIELPVRRLFESPTVAELAQIVEQLASSGRSENLAPIARVSRDQDLPLSFAQQRLWFLDQLQPGSASYNLPAALRLTGAIRTDAIEQAFTKLIQRHESLRTAFKLHDGQPVQIVAPLETISFSLPLTDLSRLAMEAAEIEARRLAEEEAIQPFDLTTGPLLRVKLLRLAEQEHVLLVTMHHIVSDGWSMSIMVREFSQTYEACSREEEAALPELPIQYADFSVWQRGWLQGAILEQQLNYWKQQLAVVQPLELPGDRPRPAVMNHKGASLGFTLDSNQAECLKLLSRRQGTTLYMSLLAAFKALLFRYSGQDDIAIGSPIAGRRRTETEGLVGFFINTMVMRTRVSGGMGFAEFLRQVRDVTLGAYSHQDVPFEKVVEELQPERDLSRTPLFQVVFALQNAPRLELQLGTVKLQPFDVDSQTTKFDLTMSLSESQNALQGWLGYYAEVFEPATISRMIGHYCTLINGIIAEPERSLAELPLLDEAERHQVVVDWNATQRDYPQDRLIHQFFESQAKQISGHAALIFEGEELSYAELNARANQAARHLQKLGVGPETAAGICLERGFSMMVALLGTLKAGAAYVPLDPSYPAARLAFMLQDAGIKVLLTQEKFLPSFINSDLQTVCLDLEWAEIEKEDRTNLSLPLDRDSLAYIIYTSGSTGVPKGAMNTHSAIANRLIWMQDEYGLNESDCVMQKTPISFDVSVWELFWPLMTGATLVLARPEGHRDSDYLVDLIVRKNITTLHFVPSMLRVFLEHNHVGRCASLKRVIASGEALSADLASQFYKKLGAELHNLYGPTEAAVDVTAWPCPRQGSGASVPIGRPIANLQIYILDREMQPVPIGVAGEIYIGGAGLARGYLHRPALTAERFVPHPFEEGQRLYRVGDIGRYKADGVIEFLGRVDHQEKIRGFRIELGEIESALREHAAVHDVAVVAREYQPGDKRLVAYVVPDEHAAAAVRTLARYQDQGLSAEYGLEELPGGLPVLVKNRSEARFLYQEIFENDSYAQHNITLEDGDTVFDVGANIGMFSLYIGQQCVGAKGAKVYAFEPIPELCALLRMNIGLWNIDAQVFDCGLSSTSGRETFLYYPHVTILSGSSADAAEEKKVLLAYELNKSSNGEAQPLEELIETRLSGQQIDCRVRTISEIIREKQIPEIDLLKIDVEKSEGKVLAGIEEEHWAKIRQVVVEVHDIDGRLGWATELLEDHGYVVTVEQESALRHTGIFVLYAIRPGGKARKSGPKQSTAEVESTQTMLQSCGPSQLQSELSRSLAQDLPAYMVPASFVFLDRLPLLPNGKLDRKALPSPENTIAGPRVAQYVPPETPVERRLSEIFSGILKKDRIGLHDNFFALGGHSLLVFRLKTMIQDQFGCDLSLPGLFQDPTIAGLAKLIEGQAKDLASSILAPLQPAGSGTPFFCVHPVGGQVVCYAGLASELGKSRPFYGLQSPTSSEVELSTIEQMATLYIKEIKRVQASGPYLLCGWSMGGLVAFEMAHQLIAQDQVVGLLALFDTVPPAHSTAEAGPGRGFSMLERFALDMARLVLRNPDELRERFLQSDPEEQFQLLANELVREQVLSQETSHAELNRLLGIFTRNAQAMDSYLMRPIKQRIVLFPAAGREAPERLAHQWELWTTMGVDVRPIPGDHYTILKPPHVAMIAAELNNQQSTIRN